MAESAVFQSSIGRIENLIDIHDQEDYKVARAPLPTCHVGSQSENVSFAGIL
jgi:hypothetical protein